MSLNRTLANLINTDGDVKAASLDLAASITVVEALDSLPTSSLSAGDQAFVKDTSRFYVSNGSGWYNAALVNATPSLSISPTGTIELNTDGSTTTITLTATDSDYPDAALTYSVESDGSFFGLATLTQDSSVFTITPLGVDSATTTSAVLTFKASDGISFGSGDRTLTLEFKVTNSNYTTLLLKADNDGTDNQVDASSSARAITEYANITSTAFTPYHPGGYSVKFDGTGDELNVQGVAGLQAGTSDFSISMWVYPLTLADKPLASDVSIGTTNRQYWRLLLRADGSLWFGSRNEGGAHTEYWAKSATGLIEANKWHHVYGARINNTLYTAVDGSMDVSVQQQSDGGLSKNKDDIIIGGWNYTGYEANVHAYIRDAKFNKGTVEFDLSADSSYTVPTGPVTADDSSQVLLCASPMLVDLSSNDATVTTAGDPTIERFGPYDYLKYTKTEYGGSIYNDGTGDYMTTPADTTDLTMSGDFTIDFWYYPTAAKTNGYVYGKYNNNSDAWAIFVTPNYSSGNFGYVTFYYGNYGSNESATNLRSSPVRLNMWHYIRITRESSVFYMSVNGKVGTRSNYGANGLSWSDSRTFNANTVIGIAGQSNYVLGQAYLADFRVINGTALTTEDFTPPTAPVTAVTDTKLLTCTNKNDIWDAGIGTTLTKYGNTTASATQTKFATSDAIYLDGSGDYLLTTLPLGPAADFTIEGWFYSTSSSNRGRFSISSDTDGLSTGTGSIAAAADGSGFQLYTGSGETGFGGGTQSLNTWQHYALVRSGSTMTLYVDGTSVRSATNSVDRTAYKYLALGGYYSTSYLFQGYIQDFRISIGLARYTSSFTPPTTEFSG